jgi:predicted RNase H-like HicB family nuclease
MALFQRADDGSVWGWIPEIPGATGMGDTVEEAEASLRAGLAIWIETERESGRPIPAPSVLAARPLSTDLA